MEREELLRSKEYWLIHIQNKVFNLLRKYKEDKKLTQSKLALELGVTKGYVSQIMNGDYDHKVSKLVDLALACEKVPVINFVEIGRYIESDIEDIDNSADTHQANHYHFWVDNNYKSLSVLTLNENIGKKLLDKIESIKNISTVSQQIPTPDFQYSSYSQIEWQKR